jgi:hypothetical protein
VPERLSLQQASAPRAVKEIRRTLAQMDQVLPELEAKQKAALLTEKGSLLKTLFTLERETEQAEQAEESAKMTQRIAELSEQLSVSAARVKELERENARLTTLAGTRKIEYVPDPAHASVQVSLESQRRVVTLLVAALSDNDQTRMEVAVRVVQSCNQVTAEEFCRTLKIDMSSITRFLQCSEAELRRLASATDVNGSVVRAVLTVRFPAPVKKAAEVPAFIPDLRSAEEKLRDAKRSVRSGL